MKTKLVLLSLLWALATSAHAQGSPSDPFAIFNTNFGVIKIELYANATPGTVANFANYVNSGAYTNSIFHRSVKNFVIQGGGYTLNNNAISLIPANAPIKNEAGISNTRGTISMAKVAGNADSATSQWFFNTVDNSTQLDAVPGDPTAHNGGYTVFGKITDDTGLMVMDQIAGLTIYNASGTLGADFKELPLKGPALTAGNFVVVNSISILPEANTLPLFLLGGVLSAVVGYRRIAKRFAPAHQ